MPHEHRHIRSLGIERQGEPYFFGYDEGPAGDGQVRLDLLYTGLSAGTELTFLKGTNPYLHSRWDDGQGLFVPGEASAHFPVNFLGYMEVARVIDARAPGFANGDVVATTFGHKTGHTATPAHDLLLKLPAGMDPMLGIFVAQMGPIAANGILHADADQLADFQRHTIEHLGIDAEIFRAHQGFAAKFEQNAFVARLTTTHLLSHCVSLLRRCLAIFILPGSQTAARRICCEMCSRSLQKRLHARAGSLFDATV